MRFCFEGMSRLRSSTKYFQTIPSTLDEQQDTIYQARREVIPRSSTIWQVLHCQQLTVVY